MCVCYPQGLLELELALPTDSAEPNGLNVLRRLWVAKFDVEEEGKALADKLVKTSQFYSKFKFCLSHTQP